MEVKSCRRCKALFHHVVGPQICPKCKQLDEEDFQNVKEYLYENPGATMPMVCEEANVTVRQVQRYLREGRLTVAEDSPIGIDCESCGTKIQTGRYCDSCRAEMSSGFRSAAKGLQKNKKDKPKLSSGNKMRYLDSDVIRRKR